MSVLSTLAWVLALALPMQALGLRLFGQTKPLWHSLLLLLCLLLLQLPTNPSPAAVLGGLFGELSITSLVLLVALFLQSTWKPDLIAKNDWIKVAGLIALAGWIFYPLLLGLDIGLYLASGPVDPYAWGYANSWPGFMLTAGVLTLATLIAWLCRHYFLALVAFLPLLAWQLGLLGSSNLWNYLFDPFVVLGTSLWLLAGRKTAV
jgi:hypothetical protein